MTRPIRVLIVDDSAFARKVLREVLMQSRKIEVVGIARDGLEALEKAAELTPDVITLDLMMPNLDGIGVLESLGQGDPDSAPRVVIVSTSGGEGELAIRALERGAVDIVVKPTALATDRLYDLGEELRRKVEAAFVARPERAPTASAAATYDARKLLARTLVAIGTSTGGPQALTKLLTALPGNFPLPLVIALHIPPGYTGTLARRIDEAAAISVIEAAEGVVLRPGLAVIARGGEHLQVLRRADTLVCKLGRVPSNTPHFPSVDVLFESVAQSVGAGALGLVLTGMGDDGRRGAQVIRAAGGIVLTESAESCVVYGMPRSVVEAGLSDADAPLAKLPELLLEKI